MAEFSTSSDIERWLRTIEPAERRCEAAIALAARAALRVTPLLGRELKGGKRTQGEILSTFILPPLRATALSWAAARYPTQSDILRRAAFAVTVDAFARTGADDDAVRAAARAARAAFVTSDAADAIRAAVNAAVAAERAVDSATDNLLAVENVLVVSDILSFGKGKDVVAAANDDAALITSGRSAAGLAATPLWRGGAPVWATAAWRDFKSALLADRDHWRVWTDWYEARLAGDAIDPPNEALEVARATIPDAIWKQGSAAVNAEIKRLVAEHEKGKPLVDDPQASVATADDREHDQADFAPILAARETLRALPLLAIQEYRPSHIAGSQATPILAVFRALAVAWARVRHPDSVSRQWCVAAGRSVRGAVWGSELERHLARSAADASFSAGSETSGAATARASSAQTEAQQAMAFAPDRAAQVAFRLANSSDASDIVAGVNPGQVAEVALWAGRDPPPFLRELWYALKESLSAANEGWEVWIDWYEARLDGRVREQKVELAYVEFIRNVVDSAPARVANAEIKRLIDLHTQKPPADLPQIESIPEQERTGTRFGVDAHGRIDVVRVPPATDELQRFHYAEMRHKAQALAALGQMLGDVGPATNRILEALPERMEDASVDKLWSRANTLRRRHDAHVRAIDNNLGPDPARLDALVAAALGDFVDSFNVYVLGDPRALELDSARLGPQDREAARKIAALASPIAHAASDPQSPATPAAQETLTEQVGAAVDAPDDVKGDLAVELARKTTGNFVSELLRWAYAPIAKLGGGITKEALFALKEFRSGFYRAPGTAASAALSVAAYAYWPEISAFIVRNADALKAFVTALFHNPRLVEIIDLIVQAAKHFG